MAKVSNVLPIMEKKTKYEIKLLKYPTQSDILDDNVIVLPIDEW